MKQAKVNLPSGAYLIQEVPEDASRVVMGAECPSCLSIGIWHCAHADTCGNNFQAVKAYKATAFLCSIMIKPSGSWQLLGADPTNLTEVEAGEIVERITMPLLVMWKNYAGGDDDCGTPVASLDSLAASLQISKPFVVLKNIEK